MSITKELAAWCFEKKCQKTAEALNKRGFMAIYTPTREEAIAYILDAAKDANTIGFGGSMSIADLGIFSSLSTKNKELFNHNLPNLSPEEKLTIMKKALLSDLYLTGINAITTDGLIINIDATGNRIAAMTFGPGKVIAVAGRNKIVEGDLSEAIKRVKSFASPPNARRLSFKTPCAETGFCSDCSSPQRICRVISIMERAPRLTEFHVILINEELGF